MHEQGFNPKSRKIGNRNGGGWDSNPFPEGGRDARKLKKKKIRAKRRNPKYGGGAASIGAAAGI